MLTEAGATTSEAILLTDPQLIEYIQDHALYPPLAILIHGSHADGFARCGSDIDVLMLTTEIYDSQPLDSPFGHIHVEYYPLPGLQQEVKRLDDQLRHRILDFNILVTRLRTAIILYDPQGVAHDLVRELQSYKPSDRTRCKFLIQAIAFREDAISAYRAGDWIQALVASRLSAESLAFDYLVNHGIINLNLKWQHHFLERTVAADDPFLRLYNQVLALDGPEVRHQARDTLARLLEIFREYDTPEMLQRYYSLASE